MLKSKTSAAISLVLLFGSGVLVGVVASRLYMVRVVASSQTPASAPRPDPEQWRRRLVAEMRDRVKLDEEQVRKLNIIYDETRQEFDQLHKKANSETRALWDQQTERIKAILRPDQVALYDQLRAEREAERKRRHEREGGRGGPGRGGPPPPR